jgi:SAM-dependent methyltransferase
VVEYDRIGHGYTATRRTDPRIAARIWAALGDARSVLNVGAGAGSYEPRDRPVVAIEPSAVMRAQRPPDAPAAIDASAERLPLDDASVDAAMAVFSDHHWTDRQAGLREMARVARRRVVLFNADPALNARFWFTTDYLPGFARLIAAPYERPGVWEDELRSLLGDALRVAPVPIPHDCRDGFYGAYWRRPEAYLDPVVRDGISVFAQVDRNEVAAAVERLRGDLGSGRWAEDHRELLELDELDLGYRLVVAELR